MNPYLDVIDGLRSMHDEALNLLASGGLTGETRATLASIAREAWDMRERLLSAASPPTWLGQVLDFLRRAGFQLLRLVLNRNRTT